MTNNAGRIHCHTGFIHTVYCNTLYCNTTQGNIIMMLQPCIVQHAVLLLGQVHIDEGACQVV